MEQAFSWPMIGIFCWLGIFICFVISVFCNHPMGKDPPVVSTPTISWIEGFLALCGIVHYLLIWPLYREDLVTTRQQVICTQFFNANAIVCLILGIMFTRHCIMTIWTVSRVPIATTQRGICYGKWRLIDGQTDSCVCALKEEYQDNDPLRHSVESDEENCDWAVEEAQDRNPDDKFGSYDCTYHKETQ
eukprot:TRINITY_DN1267_c0_g1_i1.p2 TRINITY_DN1267_c0_g1~~TRINITY_DN1267_c0_g1_i1.p2  ORF type:complete len:189 (-),score=10.70 TRINITY_DN1267_c0_g1_i1:346-912(-)